MDSNKKQKQQNKTKHTNVLESLKDVGSDTSKTIKKDLIEKAPKDFIKQLLGTYPEKRVSGEIKPGEALEVKKALTGEEKENEKLKKQIKLERRLKEEEKTRVEKKSQELRLQLHALQKEVVTLAKTTKDLGEETKIAAMQAPVEPGVYHIVFFEKLIGFIKSFRKKIEEASVWLNATNKRAEKKNYWARYKKHGSKFLLAPDHYLTRSAG